LEEAPQPQKRKHEFVIASIYWRLGRMPLAYLIHSFVYATLFFWSSPSLI
jgi:hypothetical protein